MKTTRFLLAAALVAVAAACSGDVTAPPTPDAPASRAQNAPTQTTPTAVPSGDGDEVDSGTIGSGVGR